MFRQYVDFDIQINSLGDGRYPISVRGLGGDASSTLTPLTHDPAYQAIAARLAAFDTDEALLTRLGQLLFDTLLPGKTRDIYIRTQGMLGPGQALRLRILFPTGDSQIAALPWEFLYDPDRGPLALLDAPIMRYLSLSAPLPTLAGTLPLKMLLSGAQTPPPVAVSRELSEIQSALSALGANIQVTSVEHLTRKQLQQQLRDGIDIWHFVGHGGFDQSGQMARIYLEDASGDAEPISATELNILLHRSGVRLVVLNACEGGRLALDPFQSIAPALIRAQVPAVVAMQFMVPQESTRAFASQFYRTLAEGFPIDACVTEGRKAVVQASGLRNPDWGIPVVYSRAPDGYLFQGVPATPKPSASPDILALPPEGTRLPEIGDFVGREAELSALVGQLTMRHLTIITGMSGIGKTSLAAALARQVTAPRNIFWHTFHKGEGLDSLTWDLARFLAWNGQPDVWQFLEHTRQAGGQTPPPEMLFDYLIQTLRGHNYLLCFDDFQFVDQDQLIGAFVQRLRTVLGNGDMALIVTSRRMPDVVPALDVLSLTGLSTADATRLLEHNRVTLASELVEQLVASTGGNAQLLILSINTLQKASDQASAIARLAESDDVERYLMREVDAGLSENERAVMCAVAALLGYSATRDAIAALFEGSGLRRVLHELVERSLLIVSEGEDEREYRQHAIVQAFYYEQLSKRERQKLHRQAAAYYEHEQPDALRAALFYQHAGEYTQAAALATADVWSLINHGQSQALCSLLQRFSAAQLSPELWGAVQIALGTAYPYIGANSLARQTNESAWAYLAQLRASPAVQTLQARACAEMGRLLKHSSPKTALEWLQRGLAICDELEQMEQAAYILVLLGSVQITLGDYRTAQQTVERGMDMLPAYADYTRCGALLNLGLIAHYHGDSNQAVMQTQQALELARRIHADFLIVTILGNLGLFKDVAGAWDAAVADYGQAAALAERLGRQDQRILMKMNLGLLSINRGDDATALRQLCESLELARANRLDEYALGCLSGLADLHLRRGQMDAAEPYLLEAMQIANNFDQSYRLAELHRRWAEQRLERGDPQRALNDAARALELARALGDPIDEGLSLRAYGQALRASADQAGALAAFRQSADLLADEPYEAARTNVALALILCDLGDADAGRVLLAEAQTTFARLQAQRDIQAVEAELAHIGRQHDQQTE